MSTVDPVGLRAQACAELGLLRELAQPRRVSPHPKQAESSGYPIWNQEEQLKKWDTGEETKASSASLYWWNNRIIPYCRMDNRAHTQIVGTDMIA